MLTAEWTDWTAGTEVVQRRQSGGRRRKARWRRDLAHWLNGSADGSSGCGVRLSHDRTEDVSRAWVRVRVSELLFLGHSPD